MNTYDTISIQEVRRDLPGFFRRIAEGQKLTVISRSKPVVTVSSEAVTRQPKPKGTQYFLDLAARAAETSNGTLDKNKSIKQLYRETMAEKYGIR
jgi:antitoxin (DNA-binding transcriptional repressor) of toxin-antitoxin stability system